MKRLILAAASVAILSTGLAFAGGHLPQEKRQAAMKEVGNNMGVVGKMAKGETEFDGAAALAAFQGMQTAVQGWGDLFPEGSETGSETEASPQIFSDRDGFNAKIEEFQTALASATQAAPADREALGATLGMVGKNCQACHEVYRVKSN